MRLRPGHAQRDVVEAQLRFQPIIAKMQSTSKLDTGSSFVVHRRLRSSSSQAGISVQQRRRRRECLRLGRDKGGDALSARLRVNWQADAGADRLAGAFLPLRGALHRRHTR